MVRHAVAQRPRWQLSSGAMLLVFKWPMLVGESAVLASIKNPEILPVIEWFSATEDCTDPGCFKLAESDSAPIFHITAHSNKS